MEITTPLDKTINMTQNELVEKIGEYQAEALAIIKAKNHDYTRVDDAFANFRISETYVGTPVEHGIMIRMSDKMARIGNLLTKKAQVKDESLEDAMTDLSNYSLILRAYLEDKRGQIPQEL